MKKEISLVDELKLNSSVLSKILIFIIRLERGRLWLLIKPFRLLYMNLFLNTEIPRSVIIGKPLRIPHPYGIIIHPQSSIGAGCTLYHNITIGANDLAEKYGSPQVGNYCFIGAGASVIGDIQVGDNVVIAANSLVSRNLDSGVFFTFKGEVRENKKNIKKYILNLINEKIKK